MESIRDINIPDRTPEQWEEDYQNQKKRILAQDPHSKVAHGLLFYIEDNQIRSEAITYLKENYDLVCRSGGTLDKQTIKDLIIKYHV